MTTDEHIAHALELINGAQDRLILATRHLKATQSGVVTDRNPRPIPPLPLIGVGEVITDPTFGAKILRVTGPGNDFMSYRSSDSTPQRSWSADSTKFVVEDTSARQILFEFDNMRAAVKAILPFNGSDCSFHDTNPDMVYGRHGNRVIKSYHIPSGRSETVLDLDTLGLNLPEESYTGSVVVQNDVLATVCGGAVNDYNHIIVVKPLSGGAEIILDTAKLEPSINVHALIMDLSGTYILIVPSVHSNDPGHLYIWEYDVNEVHQVSVATSGHLAPGNRMWVNQDCKPDTPWDAAQWTVRHFYTPDDVENCIDPVLQPKEIYLAEHPSWTNMKSAADPFVSATYRYTQSDVEWRAWDEEVITVYPITGEVRRQCHHRSQVLKNGVWDYWATPRPNISPCGKYALFTSNWDRTLGTDAAEGGDRQDAFIVGLR